MMQVLRNNKVRVLAIGTLVAVGGLTAAAVMVEIAQKPPVFFTPGSHNLGDIIEVEKSFNNRSKWVPNMEGEPLYVCEGCEWDALTRRFAGCEWVGSACTTPPCSVSRFPCQGPARQISLQPQPW